MDGASFAKLCRETGLLGGKLNSTSVDLVFTKAKSKVSLPALTALQLAVFSHAPHCYSLEQFKCRKP